MADEKSIMPLTSYAKGRRGRDANWATEKTKVSGYTTETEGKT